MNESVRTAKDGLPTARTAGLGPVKCLVWDLDETVWDGILAEGGGDRLRPGVRATVEELDRRGILNSVASRNEPGPALERLRELGLEEYFLHPRIGWGRKSDSVARIAQELNIGISAMAFIDDQQFERDEVHSVHPDVLCLDAGRVADLPGLPEFTPPIVTEEAAHRREMYRSALVREVAEQEFTGPAEDFLAGLGMVMTIRSAGPEHLRRAEELTVRTHQLNSTGLTFDADELEALSRSADHLVLVADLRDRYGGYGTIGLTVVRRREGVWRIRLLLMSCRVLSRGVGTVLLNRLQAMANEAGARLEADFVPTDRNRIMYVTYKFSGFRDRTTSNGSVPQDPSDGRPVQNGATVLHWDPEPVPEPPDHLTVVVEK
jgi:FkbH-like protein